MQEDDDYRLFTKQNVLGVKLNNFIKVQTNLINLTVPTKESEYYHKVTSFFIIPLKANNTK